MSIELSQELRREVERAGREPVRLIDPDTKQEFVVLRADDYERLRRLSNAERIDPSFYEFEEKELPH
jgi:hypothetical protein